MHVLGTVENLTLTGTAAINATGNAGDNVLTGNSGANILDGGAGNDTLDGGTGADTMRGGGDDTYLVDNAGDIVDESANAGAGTDTVQSSVSFSLADAMRVLGTVENLTLTGTASINATGNAGDNVLTGNSGANILDGGAGNDTLDGGTGADTMRGGGGDDTYVVDNAGDIVDESTNGGAGTDTVQASVTFSLPEAMAGTVENLTLTGTAAINATGNAGNNVLTGNSGANILDSGVGNDTLNGGAGAGTLYGRDGYDILSGDVGDDYLEGGTGNDTYKFNFGDGHDTIYDNGSASDLDILAFGSGIGASDITVTKARNGSDLLLSVGGGGDTILLKGQLTNNAGGVDQILFADNTVWDRTSINSHIAA